MTTARDSQAVIEAAYLGSPKARAAQAVIEAGYVGVPKARAAQAVIEVAYIEVAGGGERFYAQVIG